MDCCKFMVIASLLFFGGTFGQLRFQRHLGTIATPTQNGSEKSLGGMDRDTTEVNGLNLDDELVSDNDVVVLKESHETVEVELTNDLMFKVCSDGSNGCMNKEAVVCYEAAPSKYNEKAKGDCRGLNQCGVQAGVIRKDRNDVFWFMSTTYTKNAINGQTCAQAVMKYSTTNEESFGSWVFESCEPLKHDGNVVRLYVQQAYPGCFINVIGAKRWFPATTVPPATALPSTIPVSKSNETKSSSSSSNAVTTWWIVGGILAGVLVLLIIGVIGFCVYDQQKKAAAAKEKADRKAHVISPERTPTLDLSPHVQKEQEKPKKEVDVKKDKIEKKKKSKKVEAAPTPAKEVPSKEATTEKPTIEPSKEKAAAKVKEVQKEKKAPPKEHSKKEKKHAQKEDVTVAAPPPPPRREGSKKAKKVVQKDVAAPPPPHQKSPTPKQGTVDTTQEETPSLERPQAAFEDGSSSPSIEKKAPKKPSKKTSAKKAPPSRLASRRRSSKKAPRHQRYPWRMNSEEWKNYQEQLRLYPRSKVIEWNSRSSSNHR